MLSPAVDNLVAQLTRLPGIGTRTAQRLAFHLLSVSREEALALADAITEVKERVHFCRDCGNLTEDDLCAICADPRRDRAIVCVVEQPVDVVSLERTHEYRGLYHVLGGALSPIDGVEPGNLRIDELFRRVERDHIEEVVLATNPTMTGEATAAFLADRLHTLSGTRVRVTRTRSRSRSARYAAVASPVMFGFVASTTSSTPFRSTRRRRSSMRRSEGSTPSMGESAPPSTW